MKLFFTFFAALTLLCCYRAESQIVKYSNDFLETGEFSALEGTSGSGFSRVSGSQAVFCNPSRLFLENSKADFSLMHDSYFSSMADLDMFSAAFCADTLTSLGAGFLRFATDDIQNTLSLFDSQGNPDYSRIKYFSAADYAVFLSVARKYKKFRFGGSLKLIYRHEGNFADAYGFGFDVSASYSVKNFAFSAVIKDITTTFDFWSVNKSEFNSAFLASGNTIPENKLEQTAPSLRLSASYFYDVKKFSFAAFFAADVFYYSADVKFGGEVSYSDMVFFRCGISGFQYDKNLTVSGKFSAAPAFGAGVKFFRFSLDYAFKAENAVGKNSNVFTLGVRI